MVAFGFSPSSGIYGMVAEVGANIFRYKGIGLLSKWVDDHIFFRVHLEFLENYNQQCQAKHLELSKRGQIHQGGRLWFGGQFFPDGTLDEHVKDCCFPCQNLSSYSLRSEEDTHYAYNFHDIDKLSELLSIPWEKSKDRPFSSSAAYIGFIWDLDKHIVSLTSKKRQKYVNNIGDWLSHAKHDLNHIQKLYGKLLHACLVIPASRSYLTNLELMLISGASNPFTLYTPVKNLAKDLLWWTYKLSLPLSRPIP